MFEILIAADARDQIAKLPVVIQARIQVIVERLRHWPDVSGAKPLRGMLKGAFRIRTGEYRLLFRPDMRSRRIMIFRVANRRDVYE